MSEHLFKLLTQNIQTQMTRGDQVRERLVFFAEQYISAYVHGHETGDIKDAVLRAAYDLRTRHHARPMRRHALRLVWPWYKVVWAMLGGYNKIWW